MAAGFTARLLLIRDKYINIIKTELRVNSKAKPDSPKALKLTKIFTLMENMARGGIPPKTSKRVNNLKLAVWNSGEIIWFKVFLWSGEITRIKIKINKV